MNTLHGHNSSEYCVILQYKTTSMKDKSVFSQKVNWKSIQNEIKMTFQISDVLSLQESSSKWQKEGKRQTTFCQIEGALGP